MTPNPKKTYTVGKFPLIFGAIWLVLCVPFIFAGLHMLKTEERYEAEGVTVIGNVTSKRIEEKRDYDRDTKRDRTTKSYYVNYTFEVLGGETLESHDTIANDIWQSLNTNDPVQIQYLRTEPGSNRIAHPPERMGGYLFCAFAGLASLVGLYSLSYYFKQKNSVKNIVQNGMLVDGVISKVYASSLTVNNVRQWKVEYTYKDLHGGQHTGKTNYMSPDEALEFKTGSKLRVRYDQNMPQKSIWESV